MIKIVVLGNGLHGLMAAYAAAMKFSDPYALTPDSVESSAAYQLAMVCPGDGRKVSLEVPDVHDYVDEVEKVPSLVADWHLLEMLRIRDLQVDTIGNPNDWAAKIGCRPDFLGRRFGEGILPVRSAQAFIISLQPLAQQITVGWNPAETSLDDYLAEMTPDVVINTLPRHLVCKQPDDHQFTRRRFYRGPQGPTIAENRILLNAGREIAFYQRVNFNGLTLSYWANKPPFEMIEEMDSPVSTTCTCRAGEWLHLGPEATYDNNQGYANTYLKTLEELSR